MFVMVAGRRFGKTWATVRWLLEQPNARIIVTSDENRRQRIVGLLQDMAPVGATRGFWDSRVISAQTGMIGLRGLRAQEIGIDDCEDVLHILFGREVGFATMNASLIPLYRPEHYMEGESREQPRDKTEGREQLEQQPRYIERPVRDNPQA